MVGLRTRSHDHLFMVDDISQVTLQWRLTAAEQQLMMLDKHTIELGCSNGVAASVGFRWSKKHRMVKLAVIPFLPQHSR